MPQRRNPSPLFGGQDNMFFPQNMPPTPGGTASEDPYQHTPGEAGPELPDQGGVPPASIPDPPMNFPGVISNVGDGEGPPRGDRPRTGPFRDDDGDGDDDSPYAPLPGDDDSDSNNDSGIGGILQALLGSELTKPQAKSSIPQTNVPTPDLAGLPTGNEDQLLRPQPVAPTLRRPWAPGMRRSGRGF